MAHPLRVPVGAVKVLCDRCSLEDASNECQACLGKRFYFWDPESGECFAPNAEPIVIRNSSGEAIQLRRDADHVPVVNFLTVEDMLTFIGEWAAKDGLRKFKLWYDDGWNCYLWPNRYKAEVFSFSDLDLARCIKNCYRALLSKMKAG